MSEVLIQRIINRDKLMRQLSLSKEKENIIETDDESFLTNMYDVRLFVNISQLDEHIQKNKVYFDKNKEIETKIRHAFENKKKVVHKKFRCQRFMDHLDEFMSQKDNKDIDSECHWNVALFYTQINQMLYRPALNNLFGFLQQDITQLHANIEAFVALHLSKNEKVVVEWPYKVATTFSEKEEKTLNKEKHSVSIAGRLDLFKPDTAELYEIKASMLSTWSQEWLVQTLCYSLFLDVMKHKVKTIYIVNVLKGMFKILH
jgi:hypothetical protein